MARSLALMSAVIPKACQRARASICCRIKGASICEPSVRPHLYQKKVQMRRREAMTSSV
jgi:hypothetical protein